MKLDSREIKKILIIKLAAIGDVMFASPLVKNLKDNYPNAQIDWLADPYTEQILKQIPGISKTFFIERPWLAKSKIKAFLKIPMIVKTLKSQRYDLAIIAHRSGLAFKLARLISIPIKVGFVENLPSKVLDVSVRYDEKEHEIERNLDLLRAIDLKISTNEMNFAIDCEFEINTKNKYIKNINNYIVINPGGGKNPGLEMSLKRWPKEHFLDLIKMLKKEEKNIILVGTESDSEICSFISNNSKVINLCSQTDIVETAALIKGASVYVGNDSGLLYIASALKVPTLGIYGPTDPLLLAPTGDNSLALSLPVECAPCYHPQATIQGEYNECDYNQKCMSDLSADFVYKKLEELIK